MSLDWFIVDSFLSDRQARYRPGQMPGLYYMVFRPPRAAGSRDGFHKISEATKSKRKYPGGPFALRLRPPVSSYWFKATGFPTTSTIACCHSPVTLSNIPGALRLVLLIGRSRAPNPSGPSGIQWTELYHSSGSSRRSEAILVSTVKRTLNLESSLEESGPFQEEPHQNFEMYKAPSGPVVRTVGTTRCVTMSSSRPEP